MRTIDWKKYLFVFIITTLVFFTALFMSDKINERRFAELQDIENRIATDIVSLETQFDLLEELSCSDITEKTVLSTELDSLAQRLGFTEGQVGADNPEVIRLKRSYTLLQIKDYLLMKKVSQKCGLDPIFILYFYSNKGDCAECTKEGHVLTYLREQYPRLRVYSFDYNLDLSALDTLITINKIQGDLPALVIEDDVYYGFQSIEDVEDILPLEELREFSTSTPREL